MRYVSIISIAFASTVATPAPGQAQAPAETTVEARMQAFLHAMREGTRERVAAFFPRRGDWTRFTTVIRAPGGDRTGAWRFPGRETPRAIGSGGPVCWSFERSGGHVGPAEGSLQMHVEEHPSGWRRVRGSRFVPPGAGPRSPVFVEWRREDGDWVVSAFGEARPWYPSGPRLAGVPAVPRDGITRDTLLVPAGTAYAADAPWFSDRRLITLEGSRYIQYGLPRPFQPGALVRIGTLERVAVYARPGDTQRPEAVMVPVRPGEFQLYENTVPRPFSC